MVPREYAVAYSEVLEIFNHISREDVEKIPNNMYQMIRNNASQDFEFKYDVSKTLKEQNVSETARVIIAILFRDYWATTEQREKIIAKENYDNQAGKCDNQAENYVNQTQYCDTNCNENCENEKEISSPIIATKKISIFRRIWNKIIGK